MKALKRVRHEKSYQYKKKRNEQHARCNASVNEPLAEVQLDLPGPATSLVLKHAHRAIEPDRHLIAYRQKLICIADWSELGWSVVAEYTTDELADNSEDKKQLEKAEQSMEDKAAKHKSKNAEPPFGKQGTRFVLPPAPNDNWPQSGSFKMAASVTTQHAQGSRVCFAWERWGTYSHAAQRKQVV